MSINIHELKFCGFYPTALTQNYIKDKLHTNLKNTPFGTAFNLILSQKDLIIKGVITLFSNAKRYIVIAYGHTLDEVLNKLLKQIKKKHQRIKQPKFHRKKSKIITDDYYQLDAVS